MIEIRERIKQSLASVLAAMGIVAPQFFVALVPALLLSMEFINLGGLVGTIEAGATFGHDFLILLIINCVVILCQHLASHIGIVTGKNLAEICNEEYCRSTCVLLGIVTELSMIASDMSMIVGVAYGINLLYRLDLLTGLLFAATVVVLFPFLGNLLDSSMLEVFCSCISGFTLLIYVLGIPISQPQILTSVNRKFHALNGETLCALMAFLGSRINPHCLYNHSSIVQKQRRLPNKSTDVIIRDQFLFILCICCGISFANYVLMLSSAAGMVNDSGIVLPTYQDAVSLIDQIFMNPAAPSIFVMLFLLSSQVTALSHNLGGQIVLLNFFKIDLPIWFHDVLIKGLAVIPAVYCIQNAGAKELYQLLLYSQVVLAMLLPPAVIPLFRISSARSIMGVFKISWHLEMCALVCFMMMLISNLAFATMLFGNSRWMVDVMENMGSIATTLRTVLVLVAFISLSFTLHLVITPLKCSNDERAVDIHNWDLLEDHEDPVEELQYDNQTAEPSCNLPREINVSHTNAQKVSSDFKAVQLNEAHHPQEEESIVEVTNEVPAISLASEGALHGTDTRELFGNNVQGERDIHNKAGKKKADSHPLEVRSCPIPTTSFPLKSLSTPNACASQPIGLSVAQTRSASQLLLSSSIPISRAPNISTNVGGSHGDVNDSTGKPLLSRAICRLLADILERFWALLFDYYGQLTDEAKIVQADKLLGLDPQRTVSTRAYSSMTTVPRILNRGINAERCNQTMTGWGSYSGYPNMHRNSCNASLFLNDTRTLLNDSSGYMLPMEACSMYEGWSVSMHKNHAFPSSVSLNMDPMRARNPYEQHFNSVNQVKYEEDREEDDFLPSEEEFFSCGKSENYIITQLRSCILKLLKLEGSAVWLFSQNENGGCDEDLIDRVAATVRILDMESRSKMPQLEGGDKTNRVSDVAFMHGCGHGCVWQGRLIVSFGVWCIHHILKLLVVETRPEMWGRYTYVLNRLQGIIDPAFSKQRTLPGPCSCLGILENRRYEPPNADVNATRIDFTTAEEVLKIVEEVEANIFGPRARLGAMAGNVAIPKGRKNLSAVLRRYKRRLNDTIN